MRLALVLALLTACGGDSFSISPLTPCPSCGPGHVVAGASTDVDVRFAADGARVVAYKQQHIAWLDSSLAITATADTDLDASHYSGVPNAGPVISAADGHAYAMAGGESSDRYGVSMTFFGLDAGGHPSWRQTFVDDNVVPPVWMSIAPSGDLRVFTDTNGAALTLGGTVYTGWIALATLSAADGSVLSARTYPSGRTQIGAAAPTPDGGLVIAGTIDGYLTIGGAVGGVAGVAQGRTVFVARLDVHGDGVWARTFVGGGAVTAASLATDGDRVYLAGTFTNTLDLGGGAMLSGTADTWTEYVAALDGAGANAWSLAIPSTIGSPSIALSPKGVLFGGGYVGATSLDGTAIPGVTTQAGVCAELVDGHAAWMLTATGAGNHLCHAVGTVAGHTYLELGAADTDAHAHTDFDTLSLDGQMRLLVEVATAP